LLRRRQIDIGQNDRGAPCGENGGRFGADPRAAAGNDSDFVYEFGRDVSLLRGVSLTKDR